MQTESLAIAAKVNEPGQTKSMPPWLLTLLIAVLLTLGYNQAFFASLHDVASLSLIAKLTALLFLTNLLLSHLGGLGKWQKPWLMLLLLISACSQYFMLNYGILIDKDMLVNALETDAAEVNSLLSFQMLPYLLFDWLLPAILIAIVPLSPQTRLSLKHSMLRYGLPLALTLSLAVLLIATQYQTYAGVFREYRQLKHQALPLSALSASLSLLNIKAAVASTHSAFATDAVQQLPLAARPRLLIMVLGETVRADHLGINGYSRNTTPRLAKRELVNFGAISACGTATAVSVPCLFSYLTQDNYDDSTAKHADNLLDVLQRSGVKVIWRNNNSGCKSMCDRVEQDTGFALNSVYHCKDGECPDLALLEGLEQKILHQDSAQSLFIVLHQQGNHGPEYYKRSLEQYKVFLPECRTNLLSDCEQQQIINAYDNAIVSTDILLDNGISLLERLSEKYDTGLLYVSDHGESLGENGVYLHGLPYWIAPQAQTKVPMLLWQSNSLNSSLKLDNSCLEMKKNISHDNLFHTILSLFSVTSVDISKALNLLNGCSKSGSDS
ncbi:MAG: phosphoethanolamine--lipid A transferase [Gammaproteobacteria bacterium]|nr:phosphoethanolamine--lipid A transferase [Gammaproteobacteria bacterium]